MEQDRQTTLLRARYTDALLEGDGNEAHRIVSDAMERGIHLRAVYLKILSPALAEVGRAWETGQINVAQEHLATGITMQQMARVREAWRPGRERETGYSVVVAAVEGELHSVGTSMIADLFYMEDRIGTVEVGKDADLILVDGNPLDEIELFADPDRIVAVIKGGRIYKDTQGRAN